AQVEVDALDRVQLFATREVEPDVQALDLEEGAVADHSTSAGSERSRNRRTERWPTRSLGLSASSIDCPTIVHARTTSVTQTPGATIAHHAPFSVASPLNEFSMSLPHEIRLGSPSPRKVM